MGWLMFATFVHTDASKVITEEEAREVLAAIFPDVQQEHLTREDDNAYLMKCSTEFITELGEKGHAERTHGEWKLQAETY